VDNLIYRNGKCKGKKGKTSPSETLVDSNKQSMRVSRSKKGTNLNLNPEVWGWNHKKNKGKQHPLAAA